MDQTVFAAVRCSLDDPQAQQVGDDGWYGTLAGRCRPGLSFQPGHDILHVLVAVQSRAVGFGQPVFPIFLQQLGQPSLGVRRDFESQDLLGCGAAGQEFDHLGEGQ